MGSFSIPLRHWGKAFHHTFGFSLFLAPAFMPIQDEHTTRFNAVFDQYFTALCYFAENITKNRDEAKDIVVASFQKYWDRRDNFSGQPQIKSFLYLVTRNACFDFLRQRNRSAKYNDEMMDVTAAASEADAQRLFIETEMLRKIYQEAAKLPQKCREVFELTYFEGLNTSQVAERLSMSVSNVTSQRSRAIYLLRIALLDYHLMLSFLAVAGTCGGK